MADWTAICEGALALYAALYANVIAIAPDGTMIALNDGMFTEPFRTLFSHLIGMKVAFDAGTFAAVMDPVRTSCTEAVRLIPQLFDLLHDLVPPVPIVITPFANPVG